METKSSYQKNIYLENNFAGTIKSILGNYFICQVFGLHWEAWALKYKTSKQKTTTAYGSYHSQCVFVPRLVVWREIYQVFGGNPAAKIILPVSP